MFDPSAVEPVVDFVAGLAGDGAALELGIGTGRIALPLARRGVRVHGIDLKRVPPGETIHAFSFDGPEKFGFDEDDIAGQVLVSHHFSAGRMWSIPFRYVWSAEPDLTARLAGMSLRERWGGWAREPFTGESDMHVSVWQK